MNDEFRVIGDPVFAISTSELLERDERTRIAAEKRLRPLVRTVKDLDALGLGAVIQTPNGLVRQMLASFGGEGQWYTPGDANGHSSTYISNLDCDIVVLAEGWVFD